MAGGPPKPSLFLGQGCSCRAVREFGATPGGSTDMTFLPSAEEWGKEPCGRSCTNLLRTVLANQRADHVPILRGSQGITALIAGTPHLPGLSCLSVSSSLGPGLLRDMAGPSLFVPLMGPTVCPSILLGCNTRGTSTMLAD